MTRQTPVILALLLILAIPCAADETLESQLVEWIDVHNEEARAFVEHIVNINSGTMNSPGVREVTAEFVPHFQTLGFDTEWIDGAEFERAGHLVARRAGDGPHILLIGHLDTVFEPDSPFQRYEARDENIASGPGIVDMKGGNVIILQALRALAAVDRLDALTVTVILIGDEERAGQPIPLARAALLDAAREADIAIAFENGDNDPETAVISRRGSTRWTLEVEAATAHSSQIFRDDIGSGAIYEAARILHQFHEELAGEEYLTFNPGLVVGGTEVAYDSVQARGDAFGKNNVIARGAVVTGDLRTLSPEQLERAKVRMREIVGRSLPGATARIRFRDSYPPMAPTDGNRELLALLDQVSRDLGFGPMKAVDPSRAGAADVAFTAGLVEMAIDGLGLLGDHEHTEEEYADLRTLPIQTKRTAVLLHRLSVARPRGGR
jgi:glutamate carboxypeptidase